MVEHYDQEYSFYDKDINFYLDEAKNTSRVLDIGIGTGRIAIPLLKENIKLDGLDYSPDILDKCKKRLIKESLQANLYEGAMQNFSLENKYDLIICGFRVFLLNLTMEDQLKTLINFKKHLTKNGKVIISFFSFCVLTIEEEFIIPFKIFNSSSILQFNDVELVQ